jgi:hydroxymethylglutaryl-CoA reductase
MKDRQEAVNPVRRALPSGFRRGSPRERRDALQATFGLDTAELDAISHSEGATELADVMVESAVGYLPVPLGVAEGFIIDGADTAIPMAVEEPSVIAAASFAAKLIGQDGGFTTWATEPLMSAQVFLEDAAEGAEERIRSIEPGIREALRRRLASLERRGGGFRAIRTYRLTPRGILRVDILIDVRDSMGANILNTCAEIAKPLLEKGSGGKALMSILTNASEERRAGARFTLKIQRLAGRLPEGMEPEEAARRIVAAYEVADADPSRAVTHNKGIMNGVSALSLATMNDTRAVEAAAHAWACRDGRYRSLSRYSIRGEELIGELELPLAMATAGGSVGFHPAARACMKILGNPGGQGLSRIAAALGLAQNFAALFALVTTGIQKGHMRLHAARMAYEAGARGSGIRRIARELSRTRTITLDAARKLLERGGGG